MTRLGSTLLARHRQQKLTRKRRTHFGLLVALATSLLSVVTSSGDGELQETSLLTESTRELQNISLGSDNSACELPARTAIAAGDSLTEQKGPLALSNEAANLHTKFEFVYYFAKTDDESKSVCKNQLEDWCSDLQKELSSRVECEGWTAKTEITVPVVCGIVGCNNDRIYLSTTTLTVFMKQNSYLRSGPIPPNVEVKKNKDVFKWVGEHLTDSRQGRSWSMESTENEEMRTKHSTCYVFAYETDGNSIQDGDATNVYRKLNVLSILVRQQPKLVNPASQNPDSPCPFDLTAIQKSEQYYELLIGATMALSLLQPSPNITLGTPRDTVIGIWQMANSFQKELKSEIVQKLKEKDMALQMVKSWEMTGDNYVEFIRGIDNSIQSLNSRIDILASHMTLLASHIDSTGDISEFEYEAKLLLVEAMKRLPGLDLH